MRGRSLNLTGVLAGLLLAPLFAGCFVSTDARRPAADQQRTGGATAPPAPSSPSPSVPAPSDTGSATGRPPAADPSTESKPEPKRSYLTIPELDLRDVPIVRYRGSPDDGPGTRIQNRGPTASPRGPDGGVGPGQVGNFLITGHRLSGTAPFRYLPRLRVGDRALVRSGSTVYVYEITDTRRTSFRSARSLAEQSAAVPGRPGQEATEPMITISTCATIEDHAAGNFWSDRFGNPEHRIDKVGVLVATRPA